MITDPSELPEDLSAWPEEWRYLFEERAAIREYDGGQHRIYAEVEAGKEIRQLHALAQRKQG